MKQSKQIRQKLAQEAVAGLNKQHLLKPIAPGGEMLAQGLRNHLAKKLHEERANQTGEEWIQMVDARNRNAMNHRGKKERGGGGLFNNIGAILILIFFIFIILSYYSYVIHWFADIFTGKCVWWSLGLLCTSG